MIEGGNVSADTHVVEPVELGYLWAQRMVKKFRDEAPHIEALPDGDYYVIKGNRRLSDEP